MTRWGQICLALALAGCAGTGAGSAGATVPGGGTTNPRLICGPRSARTLAADRRVRVFKAQGSVFGCARGGRIHRLGGARTCLNSSLVGPVRVAGNLAAYGLARCGVDTGETQVVVRRLTDGRRLQLRPAVTGPPEVESYTTVSSLVLRADGSVAWIASLRSITSQTPEIEVHRVVQGHFELLDSGPTIAPRSLRLRGSTLSWLHGGARRTATLS